MHFTSTHKIKPETQAALYNLVAAYLHNVPLPELIAGVEKARRESA
jgi:hypothetical protein